jgi:peptidoglycan/LPS O-acetylase OafA/YrhL
MSVISMTAARLARSAAPSAPQIGPALATGPEAGKKEDTLTQLLRYTPTEVVGLYVGAVSLLPELPDEGKSLADSDFTWRWVVFLVFFVATPFVVWGAAAAQARAAKTQFQLPLFEMIVGAIAFAAWAVALPNSPMYGWDSWHGWAGAIIGIVVLLLIGVIAKISGKALSRQS